LSSSKVLCFMGTSLGRDSNWRRMRYVAVVPMVPTRIILKRSNNQPANASVVSFEVAPRYR
jgi:hypothetical protein